LPENLEAQFDAYFDSDEHARHRFLRASFWFAHARAVHAMSQSASFTALASAIEALMPVLPQSDPCPKCGKSRGPGPTKQFADFVERYAPSPETSASDRRKLYALRSALSHGGKLLHGDQTGWAYALTPGFLSQWVNMEAMWETVRHALVNWLASDKSLSM
jgi:hypothetical protein